MIYYLLNYVQNNTSEFKFAKPEEIIEATKKHKLKLDNYNSLLDNIKFQRDKALAHLDRKHVNDPSFILANPPLNMTEVETCYKDLHRIVNDYKSFYDKSEFYLKNIEEDVSKDIDYLLSLIEKK